MKILISGATGFIGQHFMRRYSEYDYVVLCRNKQRAQRILGDEHRFVSTLDDVAADEVFEAIINLAGEPIVGKRWTTERKQKLQHSRWQITEQLVAWIAGANVKPKCFLSGSAIGYYGIDDEYAFREYDRAVQADFSSDLCQRWEALALTADQYTRVILLRTGVVLGADGGALKKMLLPFKLGLGGPIGSGKQWMSWIHIDDYLSALEYLLTCRACFGPYNLTAPYPVTNDAFVKALGKALKRPAIIPMPAFAMKMALGEAATLLLDGQKVIPSRLNEDGFKFAFEKIDYAMQDLLGS